MAAQAAASAQTVSQPAQMHPLQNTWTLWYDSKKIAKSDKVKSPADEGDWEEHLKQVDTISTVESFWVMLATIKKPGSLEISANYHFFKKTIKPMWEDEANRNGGKWSFTLTTKEDLYRLDVIWEELLMAMIGEYLDEGITGNHINGAVIGRRRNMVKLAIWTRDCESKEGLEKLRERLLAILKLDPSQTQMVYTPHSATAAQVMK